MLTFVTLNIILNRLMASDYVLYEYTKVGLVCMSACCDKVAKYTNFLLEAWEWSISTLALISMRIEKAFSFCRGDYQTSPTYVLAFA